MGHHHCSFHMIIRELNIHAVNTTLITHRNMGDHLYTDQPLNKSKYSV